jgi:hypothetical protein
MIMVISPSRRWLDDLAKQRKADERDANTPAPTAEAEPAATATHEAAPAPDAEPAPASTDEPAAAAADEAS